MVTEVGVVNRSRMKLIQSIQAEFENDPQGAQNAPAE